jgi:hypothetical protein
MIGNQLLEALPTELLLDPQYVISVAPYPEPNSCLLKHTSGSILALLQLDNGTTIKLAPVGTDTDCQERSAHHFRLEDPAFLDKLQAACNDIVRRHQHSR